MNTVPEDMRQIAWKAAADHFDPGTTDHSVLMETIEEVIMKDRFALAASVRTGTGEAVAVRWRIKAENNQPWGPSGWVVADKSPTGLEDLVDVEPLYVHPAPDTVNRASKNKLGLTNAEQRSQALRCACGGSDDYCVCQNVPDRQTLADRRAALASEPEPQPVAEGWVTVPMEPTKAMMDAAYAAQDAYEAAEGPAAWNGLASAYTAMLAASPHPAEEGQ